MTVVKPSVEAKTLQAKLGFQDRQLSTPVHDEMMVWLDGHIDEVACEIFKGRNQYTVRPPLGMVDDYLDLLRQEKDEDKNHKLQDDWRQSNLVEPLDYGSPRLTIDSKIWEYPIATGRDNQYVTGFVDFVADVQITRKGIGHQEGDYRNKYIGRWFVGTSTDRYRLFFEVKPDIPSTGEFLRQIRFYQNYETASNILWVVLSPDTRSRSVIVSQKIVFVEYPTNA